MIDSGEACFGLGDQHSDLDAEAVNVTNLLKYSALLLGVHLSDGVQGAMEPPPLAFHLTFRSRSSLSVCKRVELPQPFPARVPRLFLL